LVTENDGYFCVDSLLADWQENKDVMAKANRQHLLKAILFFIGKNEETMYYIKHCRKKGTKNF
jgi:hypothetical protein